jgi:riboflavin biosynthesis pyrimidine reductase
MFKWVHPRNGEVDDVLGLVLESSRSGNRHPWVVVNMVSSLDGATAIDGKSSVLGDDDDRELFRALRTASDVILVGAGTVRAENYGPVRLSADRKERRRALGLTDVPRIAVLTGRLDLEPDARLFSDPSQRPLVLTGPASDPAKREALSELAEIVVLDDLGPEAVVDRLGDFDVVLCEGGPGLNSQLAEVGRIDDLNLTVAPLIAGGGSKRIVEGAMVEPPLEMRLDRILSGERSLFLRYLANDGALV